MRLSLTLFVIAIIPLMVDDNAARADLSREDRQIRDSAELILERPEFRHFKRRSGPVVESASPQEMPSSSGSGDGNGRPQDDELQRDRERPNPPSSPSESSSRSSFGSGLGSLFGGLFQVMAYIIVGAVVILLVVLLVRALMGMERVRKAEDDEEIEENILEPDKAPGDLPTDIYVDRARKLAAEGRFHEAIAQLLLGAMSFIERSERIRFRRGLTLRDYQRAVINNDNQYDALKSMVQVYEPIGFGRRTPTETHFESTLSGYENLVTAPVHQMTVPMANSPFLPDSVG